MNFLSEWRCFSFHSGSRSNFGWNPRRRKIAVWREVVPVAFHKNTQEERKQRFRFLYNTIFSKLLFLSNYIRGKRSVSNTKRKKKVLRNLIVRLKCDRSNRSYKGGDYHFLVILKCFVRLGFCFELLVLD